jgi:hypothetical protein
LCPGITEERIILSWTWRYIPVIPTLRRLRQMDLKFKANLDYIVRLV